MRRSLQFWIQAVPGRYLRRESSREGGNIPRKPRQCQRCRPPSLTVSSAGKHRQSFEALSACPEPRLPVTAAKRPRPAAVCQTWISSRSKSNTRQHRPFTSYRLTRRCKTRRQSTNNGSFRGKEVGSVRWPFQIMEMCLNDNCASTSQMTLMCICVSVLRTIGAR